MLLYSRHHLMGQAGAINQSPFSKVPFNRWKVLPYWGVQKIVLSLGYVSVSLATLKRIGQPKQKSKQQESKEQGLEQFSDSYHLFIALK